MIIFFILSFIYFLLLPISYLLIVWWQKLRRTKVAPYKLYNAMVGFGTDEKMIFDILQSDIDIQKVYLKYHELYDMDLTENLQDELDNDTFNKALIYLR